MQTIVGNGASMIVRTPREIGLLIRDRRLAVGVTQAALAERVGASREWVRLLESGKPRLDLGLTLRALTALNITLNAEFGPTERS
jgi:transcriptional regulator with XRE-family HTH domain